MGTEQIMALLADPLVVAGALAGAFGIAVGLIVGLLRGHRLQERQRRHQNGRATDV